MSNFMNTIMSAGHEVTDLVRKTANNLLQDPVKEESEQTSDRMAASMTYNASSTTQAAVKPAEPFKPVYDVQDYSKSMGYSLGSAHLNPNKMVNLKRGTYTASNNFGDYIMNCDLPRAFWANDKRPAWGQARYFKFLRASMHIQVTANAAMGACGALLVTYMPKWLWQKRDNICKTTLFNLPHVVLNVGTTSQVDFKIPFVNENNYCSTYSDDLGYICIMVLSPLKVAAHTSNVVDISILGSFIELDFQGPRPPSNQGPSKYKFQREKIDIAEGPGVLNLSNTHSTTAAQSIALIGERANHDRKVTGSCKRVESFKDIIQVDSLMTAAYGNTSTNCLYTWNSTAVAGDSIASIDLSLQHFGNLGFLSNFFHFWRGSLVFTIQAILTPMHKGRLLMAVNPTGNDAFDIESAQNLPYVIYDAGLNSSVSLTIPFTSQNWCRKTTDVGMVRLRVFVLNRLVHNLAAPNSVNVLLYVRAGKDFEFYSPRSTPALWQSPPTKTDSMAVEAENSQDLAEAAGLGAVENTGSQEEVVNREEPLMLNYSIMPHHNFTASHMDLDHFFGRGWYVGTVTVTANQRAVKTLPVPATGHASAMKIFNFWSGELNIHVSNNTGGRLEVSHSYVTNDLASLASNGCILVPPGQLASFCVPYYDDSPVRNLKRSVGDAFGHLFLHPLGGDGSVDIWMSLRGNNFSFPLPFPLNATARSLMEEPTSIPNMRVAQHVVDCYNEDPDMIVSMPDENAPDEIATLVSRTLSFFRQEEEERVYDEVDAPANQAPKINLAKLQCAIAKRNPFQFFNARKLWVNQIGLTTFITPEDPNEDMTVALIDKTFIKIYRNTPLWLNIEDDREEASSENLLQCGDIESNPGPTSLVYKNRGIYKHYGIKIDDTIFQMDSENVLETILSGQVQIVKTPDDGLWSVESTYPLDYFARMYCEKELGEKYQFSCVDNCETWAKRIIPHETWTQATALGFFGTMLVGATLSAIAFRSSSYSDISMFFNQSGDSISSVVQKATAWFSSIFTEVLEADITKFLAFGIARLVCYLTMYAHAPNLITTVALGALLFMDVRSIGIVSSDAKALLTALVEGDVKGLCTQIAEKMHGCDEDTDEAAEERLDTMRYAECLLNEDNETKIENQDLRDFNTFTTSAKNIEWWLGIFQRLRDWLLNFLKPSTGKKFITWVEENTETIAGLLTTVNTHLKKANDIENLRDPKFHEKHKWLVEVTGHLLQGFCMYAPSNGITPQLRHLSTALLRVKLQQPYNTNVARVEPIGICVRGAPGVGKSFFTNLIMKKIAEGMGWDLKTSVFPHPIGSQYFDGYHQQKIHFIDDMGQNSEELDLGVLCQCISTIPFPVPMAGLEEKGVMYDSSLVIATTNKPDFTSRTLLDPDALARRFKYSFAIRPKQSCAKGGRLEVATNMEKIKDGTAWEICDDVYDWKPFKLDEFVNKIVTDLKNKENSFTNWNTFMSNQGPDAEVDFDVWRNRFDLFVNAVEDAVFDFDLQVQQFFAPDPPSSKIKAWFKRKLSAVKSFIERNKTWITLTSAVCSGVGLLASIIYLVKINSKKEETEQKVYNPSTMPVKKLASKFQIGSGVTVASNQAPFISEMSHIYSRLAYIEDKDLGAIVHCLPIGDNKAVVYGHGAQILERMTEPVLNYKQREIVIDKCNIHPITTTEGPMDSCILKFEKLPIIFKSIKDLISPTIGTNTMLVWTSPAGNLLFPVANVHETGTIKTMEGTESVRTYTYVGKTVKGMCGGILISKVQGAFKIHGMHIAGTGSIGMAADLNFVKSIPMTQGVIVSKKVSDVKVFQPSKTALVPSPLHGHWPVEMQPAVLSPFDKRLEVDKPFPVLKTAAQKYRVDHFNAPDNFKQMKMVITEAFIDVLGVNDGMSIEDACLKEGDEHELDLSTSPGFKFVSKGLKKKDLVDRARKFIHPDLRCEVRKILETAMKGETPDVLFQAHLKDELRKNEKIPIGKTRCIEACDFDYTVAHKMVFGKLYEKIYSSDALSTGLAVGMNPWKDWEQIQQSLYQYNYDFDYSAFDGSLSEGLMREAADILCACVENSDLAITMLEPVIISNHLVMDEEWEVKGGMPSGSPCTTVLNSVCNLLVSSCIADYCTDGKFKILVYGDDLIISCESPLDCQLFKELVFRNFGMEVTSGDKSGYFSCKPPDGVSFLKRTTKTFPGSRFRVGALDLENIKQHLMWSRGFNAFKSQLDSALMEVCLHGEQAYDAFRKDVKEKLGNYEIYIPKFKEMLARMSFYVFD